MAKAINKPAIDPEKLSEAVIVEQKMAEIEENLRGYADAAEGECGRAVLDGRTTTGYDAFITLDGGKVARILLNYNYPLYTAMGLDYPDEMWAELAELVGLYVVSGVSFE